MNDSPRIVNAVFAGERPALEKDRAAEIEAEVPLLLEILQKSWKELPKDRWSFEEISKKFEAYFETSPLK